MQVTNINDKRNTECNNEGQNTGNTNEALRPAEKDISNYPDLSP